MLLAFDAIVEVVDLAGIQLGIAPRYSTTNIIDAVRIEIVVAARIVDRAQAADQCQIVGEMHAELKLAAQDLIVERVVDTANRTAGIVRAGNAAYVRRDRKSVVEGKSVAVRVDIGGRRILKKQTNTKPTKYK